MLNKIRNFSNTKYAGVLVAILIVPFVLWGMGGVFSGGNKNNIAKINKENISTVAFQEHLNLSNIELEEIKKNIDNNILEKSLKELISKKMILMEVEDLNLVISDKVLNKKIKQNKNFLDENNKFSRIKYEKLLLSSNLSAPAFESTLRENERRNNLFDYISGGLISPFFLTNNIYKKQTKELTLNYINLSKIYKKRENFTEDEITDFINKNTDSLKEKFISFKYSKITPQGLIGLDEFNDLFFEKIDELENDVISNISIENLKNKYNLTINIEQNFKINGEIDDNKFFEDIYNNAENKKINLLDKNDFFVLYEITEIKKVLPNNENIEFTNNVRNKLYNKSKFEFNSDLIKKITNKEFRQSDFDELSKNNLSKIIIESINDNKTFTSDSINHLYSMSKNNFGLIGDKEKNIYLVKLIDVYTNNLSKDSKDLETYKKQSNDKIRDSIYDSYDLFINSKYKVKINEKTLERVKNYFR